MQDQAPHFEPIEDWENIRKWIKKDDAERNQLMRLAVREELKCVKPFMQRVGRLEIAVLVLGGFDIGTLIFLIASA